MGAVLMANVELDLLIRPHGAFGVEPAVVRSGDLLSVQRPLDLHEHSRLVDDAGLSKPFHTTVATVS